MNAVEIEEAVSRLAEAPFDPQSFPFAFLEAFGNTPTTIQRLKSGSTNQSDLGGMLQRNNIHLKTCAPGEVPATLTALRESPKTRSHKARFILATDGLELQTESLEGEGEALACAYPDFAAHDRNDETLERIYISRRFKNDTERLEKLFDLYTKMTANAPAAKKVANKAARRTKGGEA